MLQIEGDLEFVPGKINLITGPTGCGKTSLLMSLLGRPFRLGVRDQQLSYICLGEMIHTPLSSDGRYTLPREGGVAYAAQESWVMNETIRVRCFPPHECPSRLTSD